MQLSSVWVPKQSVRLRRLEATLCKPGFDDCIKANPCYFTSLACMHSLKALGFMHHSVSSIQGLHRSRSICLSGHHWLGLYADHRSNFFPFLQSSLQCPLPSSGPSSAGFVDCNIALFTSFGCLQPCQSKPTSAFSSVFTVEGR